MIDFEAIEQRLDKALNEYNLGVVRNSLDDVPILMAEVKRLRDALGKYADPNNWNNSWPPGMRKENNLWRGIYCPNSGLVSWDGDGWELAHQTLNPPQPQV